MKERRNTSVNAQQEVNLKLFFQKISRYWIFFMLSIFLCIAIAFVYIKLATPIYEVSTSILIDPSGKSRNLGESKYVEGGVGLIESQKNLFNEIGIIKSFSLIRQTVTDLGFDVSYYGANWLKKREYYGYFPFEVTMDKTKPQLYGAHFMVRILSAEKYRLSIEADKFWVSNPSNGSTHVVDKDFKYAHDFHFDEKVENDYFNFIIKRPTYKIGPGDFSDLELSFLIQEPDGVANSYLSNLEVENIDIQASIFKIVSKGPVIDKEVEFLKKLADNYIQNELKARNKIAMNKESFVKDQLRIVSDSLLRVELNLELFKRDKNAVNLGETAMNALNQTQNLQTERAKIETNIRYYNSLIQFVEENQDKSDFLVPTGIGVSDPQINKNIADLEALYAEKSKKKFYVTSTNQEMTILDEQIKKSTQLLLNNLRSTLRSYEFQSQGLQGQLSSYDGVINSLPIKEKELLGIQRKSTLYENLYNYLSQELAKTRIASAENISDTRVLDNARMIGGGPIAPNKMLLLILAVTLGTIVPLGYIVLFAPNDILRNIVQIMENTDIPVIASIANRGKKSKNGNTDISLWKIKESFRDLSTNIEIVRPKTSCCSVGITSIMPGEGKTFCTINLGITLAESGKKTLIIDSDLRKPSLVDHIKKVEGKGLSNYLQGEIGSLDTIIYSHDTVKNLQFIPTFIADANIHELLSGVKMTSLIHELRDRFDYILFDTPASGLVSDFLVVRDELDVNLFVLRRNIAKIEFLEDLEKLIPHNKREKSFIIFNDALMKDHKYGYGQKYGMDRGSGLIEGALAV